MEKYIKVKKIGEGSFGKAVLVKSKENGMQYVVKEISISKMQPKERQEARKEVSVLSKMRHPNIVHYVESFEESGCLYIVMEYCEGGDLYARINAQRGMAFSEAKVLDWFIQICLALKHVHDRKILHRDIKTSNIFLTKGGTVKLGDFGIARVLNNTMELARTCIGTPYYLSPEICENKPYNNKSDMWAVGCVLYEVLTLKHAFEAGNMKNLVLKIIRGSYPPVPSRYSYDLRGLVGQLFRRNPRDRPSVNTILRQPFIRRHTEKFLTPEQHQDEFSHTVLHRNKKPASARPTSAAVAYKRPEHKPRPSAKSPTDARSKQIAGIYGQSVAKRKPKNAAHKYVEQRKLEAERKARFLDAERKRKEENERKRNEELALLQAERQNRIRAEQIKRARDQALKVNLKRSAELFEPKKEADENKKPAVNKPIIPAKLPRPTSAPPGQQDQKYAKYHDYLEKLRRGDKNGAVEVAAPGLAQVKEAWNDRVSAQNAVMQAVGNKAEAKLAADHARVLNEYWERKQEAQHNKQQGKIIVHGNGIGVARALNPYSAAPAPKAVPGRNKEENEYLARLRQIRIQNFNERRALKEKMKGKPYQVVSAEKESVKRSKEAALQEQARQRADVVRQDVERRRQALDLRPIREEDDVKISYEEKARARGIVPPDERPVNYMVKPIGITQALNAVGAAPRVPIPDAAQDEAPPKQSQPVAAKPDVRKNILKRLNDKFKSEEDKEEKEEESSKQMSEPAPVKPPVRQAWGAEKKSDGPQWAAGDIGRQLAALPLQETASQMEATTYEDATVLKQAKDIVAKRGWNLPSNTVVNKLNQLSLCDPTLTIPDEDEQKIPPGQENASEAAKNMPPSSEQPPPPKPKVLQPSPLVPARSQSPVQFTVDIEPAKKPKAPSYLSYLKEKKAAVPPSKGTVVLGDISAATLDDTPEVEAAPEEKAAPKQSAVAALAARFGAQKGVQKGTFVVANQAPRIGETKDSKQEEKQEQLEDGSQKAKATFNVQDASKIMHAEVSPTPDKPSHTPVPEKPQNTTYIPKATTPQQPKPVEANIDVSDGDIQEIDLAEGNQTVVKAKEAATPQAWVESAPASSEEAKPKPVLLQKQPTPEHLPSPVLSPEKTPSPLPSPKKTSPPTKSPASPRSPSQSQREPSEPGMITPKMSSEEPLFSKVAHTPGTPSTLPVSNQVTPTSQAKLNKTMFATASDEMALKLTLGHFDSPNPKMLRTCSLPDLTKEIAEEGEADGQTEVSPLRRSAENLNADSSQSSRAESPATPPPSPTPAGLMASVASSMNDTNFDDGDEMMPGSSQEDGALLEEDEDFASLRANLQNVLLKDDDTGFSSDDEAGSGDEESKDEAWESDDESSSNSSDHETDDVSDTESVFSRLEANRVELEAELGFEEFMRVYKYVQAIHEDEEEEIKDGERRIRAILGEKHDRLYPRILQLVMADGAYCEDNS